jgi:OOP family OmpA-OmpF porin
MKIKPNIIPIILASVITVGCANNKSLSQDEAFQAYPSLAKLQQQVDDANQNNLDILSPKAYLEATKALAKANKMALKGKDDTQKVASQGLTSLDIGIDNSEKAKDVFEDVLAQRQRTINAYGDTKQNFSFQEAEKLLLKLTTQFENKEFDAAKAGRAELIQKYAELELKAVKSNVLEQVKKEIALARDANLDDIAPKTFKLAIEELDLAISTLNIDRNDTVKAGGHAQKSLWHLNRAKQIDDMLKNFKTSDYSEEDKILWYQSQLDKIALPLNQVDLYDRPNKIVITTLVSSAKGLNNTVAKLSQELTNANSQLTDTKQNLTKEAEDLRSKSLALTKEKDQQIEALRISQEKEQQRQQAIANKFSEVQQLFDDSEAEVYRQVDDVLVRAHGFAFKSGNSEIDSSNFALLNKIIETISKFENSKILVSGHTDSLGSDQINMSLSQQRADKVAQFLVQVGRISPQRIEHKGFGESRPVASNETDEGKASNRRVEILIKNSKSNLSN